VEPAEAKSHYEALTAEAHPRYPHFDVRQSARTYASIGGTLSGFSFAAVVLLARSGIDCSLAVRTTLCTPGATSLRDRAATAFLIAFFGCVTGAFVYAITGAEELLSKRAHSMGFFGSSGFALGIGYAFWGLALLSDLFLGTTSGDAVVVANLMVIGVALAAPAFLAFPALDIKMAFGSSPPTDGTQGFVVDDARGTRRDWLWALLPGYVVVACGIAGLLTVGSQLEAAPPAVFTLMFVSALAFAVAGVLSTLFISARSLEFSVTPRWAGIYAAVHTGLLWMLVLLLPPFG
jgi:hypothetical protein